MQTTGVRIHGAGDVRMETFELPKLGAHELLARVVTDSMCMSTYKAVMQGSAHRCIPDDIAEHPCLIGHELCAVVEQVGEALQGQYQVGEVFTAQPKMYRDGKVVGLGYTFPYYGGDATHIIIPQEAINGGYLLPYQGKAYYSASVAEPISCLVSALRSMYHLKEEGSKEHVMGLKAGGKLAIIAGCGPMGLGCAAVAMAMEPRPSKIVITDINEARVRRAREVLKPQNGVELEIVNTAEFEDTAKTLRERYTGGAGFDDVMIMAPVPSVAETADAVCGTDSCINFFAGPTRKDFFASINLYDVHYNDKHLIGTSGGDMEDLRIAVRLLESGAIDASILLTHIGGLDAVAPCVCQLPSIPGGKKLIYCGLRLPLTAIDEFEEKGKQEPLFAALAEICKRHGMLWNAEAEAYLLAHGERM